MDTLKYEDIQLEGEAAFRIIKNFTRLEDIEYRPDTIFDADKTGWPGDWEGRTILALVLLSRVTHRKAAYLDKIILRLKEKLNERGYLKNILPDGYVNEQQLSGHNWLLRGLLEYYLWTGNEDIAEIAKRIVENLFIPAKDRYADYPVDPKYRSLNGGAAGHIEGEEINHWYLSTDIGCAFMSMDALSQYYEIFGDNRVAGLLDEMAASFMKIDLVNTHMQTHASLSACRGLMRYYQCTGRKELLHFLVDFFKLYMEHGMTENYANFNWFGIPSWTETCAIVDSYLLTVELFKEVKDLSYLETANRIYYNAMGFAQRNNGGFGCDRCVGFETAKNFISVKDNLYEAYWCCSMRGAEGLSGSVINSILYNERDIYFIHYFNGEYVLPRLTMKTDTSFPEEGHINITLTRNIGNNRFHFYIPQNVDKASVKFTLNGNNHEFTLADGFLTADIIGCGEIKLVFHIPLQIHRTINKALSGKKTFWHGVLLLGVKTDNIITVDEKSVEYYGKGKYKAGEYLLEPINQNIYVEREELLVNKLQLLF